MRRGVAAAIVVPPLGAGFFGVVLSLIAAATRQPAPPLLDVAASAVFLFVLAGIVGAPLAWLGMLVFGLPTWALLRWARAEGALGYALAGVAGGLCLPPIKGPAARDWPTLLLWQGLPGAIVLLLFWWVARERTPPRQT